MREMWMHNFNIVIISVFGVLVTANIVYAHPPAFHNESSATKVENTNNENGVAFKIRQLNTNSPQVQKLGQHEQIHQKQKYVDKPPNFNYLTTSRTSSNSPSTALNSSSSSAKSSSGATATQKSFQTAYIYKAEIPAHTAPESNIIGTSDGLALSLTANNTGKDDALSKKIIGSSVVTSVSVVLNGDEFEFTDALGQKVPKPQPSLHVSSPINLLNPDRYEFYTFDEHGELVKRLMTMEQIQSIVANGDGEGPTIIHHGPIEDRNPEKNIQDIVKNVQSVLNKEVKTKKNDSTERLPVFDTPDTSASWSMILPAIFANSGSVDLFPHQRPQQIVMTPESELIENITIEPATTTTKKPKPYKRKPGQKRKSTTTTTEMTPQVIQEELDSHESVYTGMQQYQSLAATMQNYDGFSQLQVQPIYQKVSDIESSTRMVFINNKEIVTKPVAIIGNDEIALGKKNTSSVYYKPMPSDGVKTSNAIEITSKQPLSNETKIKKKPTFTTTITPITSKISTPWAITKRATTSATYSATTAPDNIRILDGTTTKPTRKTALSSMITHESPLKPYLTAVTPHGTRPEPTKNLHIVASTDLAVEETSINAISNNKLQNVLYHKMPSRPNKPIHTTDTTTIAPITTQMLSPVNNIRINVSLFSGHLPEFEKTVNNSEEGLFEASTTTDKPTLISSIKIPATSGYPVPSYGTLNGESEVLSSKEYNHQPFSSLAQTQHINRPYEPDTYTLQSFDQILNSLKNPERIADHTMENAVTDSQATNIKYQSAQHKGKIKENVHTFMNPSSSNINPNGTLMLNSSYDRYAGSSLASVLTEAQNISKLSKIQNATTQSHHNLETNLPDKFAAKLPNKQGIIYVSSENQLEHTTEDNTVEQEYDGSTGYSEIFYTSPVSNGEGTVTGINQITDPTTEAFKLETLTRGENIPSHTIFVANLEPQLNLKVVKPSEQITMSNFQTQAATVASTLIDGANTIPFEDTLITTNEMGDKLALLMSDVIHQISDTSDISIMKETNFDENRLSNQAQLDLPFLTSMNKVENQKTNQHASNNKHEPNYQEEQLNNVQSVYQQSENPEQYPTPSSSITEIPETTTLRETYNGVDEKMFESIITATKENFNSNYLMTTSTAFQSFTLGNDDETTNIPQTATTTPQNKYSVIESAGNYIQNKERENEDKNLPDVETKNESVETGALYEEITFKVNSSNVDQADAKVNDENLNENEGKLSLNRGSEVTEAFKWITLENTNEKATELVELVSDTHKPFILMGVESHSRLNKDDEGNIQLSTLKDSEAITLQLENETEKSDSVPHTTHKLSEEKSTELSDVKSEEDESNESIEEDPYIKLGETTAKPPSDIDSQTTADTKTVEQKAAVQMESELTLLTLTENADQPHEDGDEEDEEDQLEYYPQKFPNTNSTSPKITTTNGLNTLKPVPYFNMYQTYAGHQKPLYNKQNSYMNAKENMPTKPTVHFIPSPQQRPIQRPPQLSNLMASSTKVTRPPVKLEPSPYNSKGLEASIANLDEDMLAFSDLCNDLAFRYWQLITSEKISSARSLVISPFALTSMLSMIFLGARGITSGEMNDVLKLDDMVTFNPHLIFKNITDSVENSMDSNIATAAFVREIYSDRDSGKVLHFFKEKTQQFYAGHVEEVNFNVVNDIIRRRTNFLIKRHTMGKVLEYLRTNSVWVNGPLAMISANLFQTDCSRGSILYRDGEIFFQVYPTARQRRLVPIPAVLFKTGFIAGYEKDLDAMVVAFGNIQDSTSVIYIMPSHISSISPSDNLVRLEKDLMQKAISQNAWSNLLTSLIARPGMEVQLPRFSHRSFINATLGLQKMGLKSLFKSDYADLGGLTGSSNSDIHLSDIIQINTFSTCGEEKIADHHVELYPAPPFRKRNKDVGAYQGDELDSSEAVIDFGSLVHDSAVGRSFYDDLLDPKYLELPLPLRPRQARVPDSPRLKFDKPFLYFVRHNPTGMILFMGRFNPRLVP